ncbi:fumarylacetoacetate hydrolase family protein [Streptomyces sp. NPDC049687]|uniref:fumarylacetoacetate hydrolase family protein n=1 Tax=Streptomyces sp. NPDC049687 TaxID=3365596 RepID=UPI0037B044C4
MTLLRVGAPGEERPAVRTEDGRLRDLSGAQGIDGAFLAADGVDRARAAVAAGEPAELDADGLRIGAPLARPGEIVCIGLNHRDHAAETGAPVPARPVVFMKDPGPVVGPYDEVLIPRGSVKTDWEVELAVVVGRRARHLDGPVVLEPGDVINTGTPAGVALGLPGTPYLRPGDTVELSVDGLGGQRQTFGQA